MKFRGCELPATSQTGAILKVFTVKSKVNTFTLNIALSVIFLSGGCPDGQKITPQAATLGGKALTDP